MNERFFFMECAFLAFSIILFTTNKNVYAATVCEFFLIY